MQQRRSCSHHAAADVMTMGCHSGGRDATAAEVMRSRCRIRGVGLGSMPLQPGRSAEQKYY